MWRRRLAGGIEKQLSLGQEKNDQTAAANESNEDPDFPSLNSTIFKQFDDNDPALDEMYKIDEKFRQDFKDRIHSLLKMSEEDFAKCQWFLDIKDSLPAELVRPIRKVKRSRPKSPDGEIKIDDLKIENVTADTEKNEEAKEEDKSGDEAAEERKSVSDESEKSAIEEHVSGESEGEEAMDYVTNYFDPGENYLSEEEDDYEGGIV